MPINIIQYPDSLLPHFGFFALPPPDLFEWFADDFRHPPSRFSSSLASSSHARRLHAHLKGTITHARFGGQGEAVKVNTATRRTEGNNTYL
jgi:hypothetical protein